jgi:membrane associated rhomboid family serine protease
VLPLHDRNPTRSRAIVTWVLIALCVAVYFLIQQRPGHTEVIQRGGTSIQIDESTRFTLEYAAIPCEIVQRRPLTVTEVIDTFARNELDACSDHPTGPELFPGKSIWAAAFTSIFLHGSVLHLLGNMWFLLLFGNNIEDRFGRFRFLLFYVAVGLLASVVYIVVQPDSTVPVIGASGAIAGVMGAYLVLYPRAPITTLIIWIIPFVTSISAIWFLLIWFVTQFFTAPDAQVAWVAHVAGFIAGAVVGAIVRSVGGSEPSRPLVSRW